MLEQRSGVGADRDAVPSRQALELGEVPHRVDRPLRRQIRRVGAALADAHPGMDLHQLPAREHPDQLAVRADLDVDPDQVPRHRTERLPTSR
jgi:hypothetical protein